MQRKYRQKTALYSIVTKAENTCSNCVFIALCSCLTMVSYGSLDKITLADCGQTWEWMC